MGTRPAGTVVLVHFPFTLTEPLTLGRDTTRMEREAFAILDGRGKKGSIPEFWDGHAAERIAHALC